MPVEPNDGEGWQNMALSPAPEQREPRGQREHRCRAISRQSSLHLSWTLRVPTNLGTTT